MTAPPVLCRIEFWVPGNPAPQGSKKHVGRGIMIESSKALGPWRERVAVFAHQAMKQAGATPFTGAVTLRMDFIMPRPTSASKTKVLPATKRPDCDKLARSIGDAVTSICFVDDSQVVDLRATKRVALFGEPSGVQITVSGPTV
jgi:crossover junction endodeoxyribonuclease RusA